MPDQSVPQSPDGEVTLDDLVQKWREAAERGDLYFLDYPAIIAEWKKKHGLP